MHYLPVLKKFTALKANSKKGCTNDYVLTTLHRPICYFCYIPKNIL